jgi:hypothetical protein
LGPSLETLPGAPETVHVRLETNVRRAVDLLPLVYVSQYLTPSGVPRAHIYRDGPGLLLCYADIADFLVCPSSVTVMPVEGSDPAQVRLLLLGPTLAVELELLGIPCLHASAVVVKRPSASLPSTELRSVPSEDEGLGTGGAVGFLAASTGGKSVLASSFVEAGGALLTDDILALRRRGNTFMGLPGYPQMKVWPEAAQELLGDDWVLDRIIPDVEKRRLPVGQDWGTFCTVAQPLLAFYVPTRLDGTDRQESEENVEITPIPPRDALMELVRHVFCARVVDTLGWQPRHLDFLAELVQRVPVRRLRYPSGFEHLPAVHAAILHDLSDKEEK